MPALTGLGAPALGPARARAWSSASPAARPARTSCARRSRRSRSRSATSLDVDAGEAGVALAGCAVDGGAAANDLLCQLQADQLGVAVERPEVLETTGLGAAFLAGLGTGVWSSTDELRGTWRWTGGSSRSGTDDEAGYRRWRSAVERAKGWAAV